MQQPQIASIAAQLLALQSLQGAPALAGLQAQLASLQQQAQPQYGQPAYGEPQYGQPQYGQPQYGQPQYGMPDYSAAMGAVQQFAGMHLCMSRVVPRCSPLVPQL